MKRLRLWLRLILIAAALLLNGINAAAIKDRRDNHKQNKEASQQRDSPENQQIIVPPSPAYQAAILETLRALLDEEVARNKEQRAEHEDWNTPTFWVSVVLAVVGAAYTLFAGWQLLVIRRQTAVVTLATRIQQYSAVAAEESAKASKLALNIHKPYLFVETPRLQTRAWTPQPQLPLPNIDLTGLHSLTKDLPHEITDLSFEIRNRGNGLALIDRVCIKQCLTKGDGIIEVKRPRTSWRRNERLSPTRWAVGPSEFVECFTTVPVSVKPATIGFLGGPRFAFIGYIRYQDVFERWYRSRFCYIYEPPSAAYPFPRGYFYASLKHRNRIEEEQQNTGLS